MKSLLTITVFAFSIGCASKDSDTAEAPTAENQAPTLTIAGPESGASFAFGDVIEVEVSVSDDRDDPSAISLSWEGVSDYATSAPASADSNGSAGFFLQDLPAGSYTLSATATDSDGAYSSEQVWFEVTEDTDGDGYEAASAGGADCDDSDADVNPAAQEVCDGVDNDCDGDIDDADNDVDTSTGETWYADDDADGYGDPDEALEACDQPDGYVAYDTDEDCDDNEPDAYPGNDEVCDGVDNDCDGTADNDDATDATTWYADDDNDDFGDPDDTRVACDAPSGYVADAGDCDDTDPAYNPDSDESDCADPNDYNCDGSTGYTDDDGDGWAACEECDDASADVNPAATEVCNDTDDDCDGATDDEDSDLEASTADTWHHDADGDGFGDPDDSELACEQPEDHVADDSDCDDGAGDVHPGADEDCDDADDDCDGTIDEDATDASVWHADDDSDGYGDPDETTTGCDQPSGYTDDDSVTGGWDCDDSDGTIYPGAAELCDGSIDEDCDGGVDEDGAIDASTWYIDADADGYGSTSTTETACEQPSGYVSSAWASDCDDGNNAANPGETEVCNGVDDDCDGTADEPGASGSTAWYADSDSDGYGDPGSVQYTCTQPAGHIADATDCDDGDNAVNPDGTELCDGADNDCDGAADEDDALDASEWYLDADSDGFGDPGQTDTACYQPASYTDDDTDCDDSDEDIFPGATEVCDGGTDEDCDGSVDEEGATAVYVDSDGDGFGDAYYADTCAVADGYSAIDGDCDDGEASINPDGTEICDGIEDEDCDGVVDEDVGVWYRDADSDGYGNASVTSESCDQPSGYVADDTDCDDGAPDAYPGAEELCDGVDSDCDGTDDDPEATDAGTWYTDADGDGFGDEASSTTACDQPSGYDSVGGDCDDTDADIHPDAPEVCDGVDNDCDGTTDGTFNVPDDYSTIQSAISAASSGDTVCVSAGTYTCPIDFGGKDLVVQGAGPGDSILDGGGGTGSCVLLTSGETADAYFGGFTITDNGASLGSAVRISYSSPTIEDIAITEQNCTSFSTCYGLGFYLTSSDSAITDVSITDNSIVSTSTSTASSYGLGLYIRGGSPVLTDVTISSNTIDLTAVTADTYVYGGLIYISYDATPMFDGLEMIDNTLQLRPSSGTAYAYGGAIYSNDNAETVLYNTNLRDFTLEADYIYGGVLHSDYAGMAFYSAIFAGVSLDADSKIEGGIGYTDTDRSHSSWDAYIEMTNADIVGVDLDAFDIYGGVTHNEDDPYSGHDGVFDVVNTNIVGVTLTGSDLNGNIAYCSTSGDDWYYNNFYDLSGATDDFDSSCPDPTGTNGNTSADPLYVDTTSSLAEYWDLNLDSGSPVENAGNPSIFDTDGSYSAIGAYGGPYGDSW